MEFNLSNFKCEQCGRCCEAMSRDFWQKGTYTKAQIKKLKDRIASEKLSTKYPEYKDGCEMLRNVDDKCVCLIHLLFGFEAKADVCRNYPANGKCLKDLDKTKVPKMEYYKRLKSKSGSIGFKQWTKFREEK